MKKHPPITEEQSARIAAWREAGRPIEWIAGRLGLSASAVNWHCLRNAIESPKNKWPLAPHRPAVVLRHGRPVLLFSAEEDAALLRLEAVGTSLKGIARTLGRRPVSIVARLATLARREERADGRKANG